jgi:hypothetical protein
MNERLSNLPPETRALLADRYGIQEKKRWTIPATIVTLIFIPLLMWSAWHHSNPEIRTTLVSFQNQKQDSIDITFLIERRNPSLALTCTLVARDIDKNVVGEIEDQIPPAQTRQITRTTSIPTRIAPVNAAVLVCRAAER